MTDTGTAAKTCTTITVDNPSLQLPVMRPQAETAQVVEA